MLTKLFEYVLGISVFAAVCWGIEVDLDAALIIMSQVAGRPWLPTVSLNNA